MTTLRAKNLIIATKVAEHLKEHLCISYKDIRVIFGQNHICWDGTNLQINATSQNYTPIITFLIEKGLMKRANPFRTSESQFKVYVATQKCVKRNKDNFFK